MAKDKKDKWWSIDKELLPLKVFYFLCYGACMVIPYMTVVLKMLNLTASEIGIITGCAVLLCMFTRPAIGMLVDRMGGRKIVLVICCLGFGCTFFCLQFISGRTLKEISNFPQVTKNLTSSGNFRVWSCQKYQKQSTYFPVINEYHISQKLNGSSLLQENITQCYITHGKLNHSGILTTDYILHLSSHDPTLYVKCFIANYSLARPSCFTISIINSSLLYTIMVDYRNSLLDTVHTSENERQFNSSTHISQSDFEKLKLFPTKSSNISRGYSTTMSTADFDNCFRDCNNIIQSHAELLPGGVIRFHLVNQSGSHFMTSKRNDTTTNTRAVTIDTVFALAFVVILIARAFYASTNSLADAAAYSLLGSNRHRWAKQRIWGSLGTGIAIFVTTAVSVGIKQNTDITAIFTVCLILAVLASLVVVFKLNTAKIPKTSNLSKDLNSILSNPTFRLLLCKLILFGFMTGSAQNFMLWFVYYLGGSPLNLAMVVVINSFSSVVVLRFTGMMLKKLGPQWTMSMVLVAHIVRYLCTSFVESPWILLVTEVMHGLVYSTLWAAASGSTSLIAPSGTQATCQSIAGAVYWDLGRGLGSLVTGQLIQVLGPRWTFRAYAAICAVAFVLLYFLDRWWPMPTLHVKADDTPVSKQIKLEMNRTDDSCVVSNLLPADVTDATDKDKTSLVINGCHNESDNTPKDIKACNDLHNIPNKNDVCITTGTNRNNVLSL